MAIEGVSESCTSEMNMFIHENAGEDSYISSHLNDNYFHSKFKIDPNELYTFADSDIIAGEITVCNTEENFVYPESTEIHYKPLDSVNKDLKVAQTIHNGEINETVKNVVSNGHCSQVSSSTISNIASKNYNTKVPKCKNETQTNPEVHKPMAQSSKSQSDITIPKASINVDQIESLKNLKSTDEGESFLDVFKREQRVNENKSFPVKSKIKEPLPPHTSLAVKASATNPKKIVSGKTPLQTQRPRRGRGPAVHEALQRISDPKRVVPIRNLKWHAPGDSLFECGPLVDQLHTGFRQIDSSSSDEDSLPVIGLDTGSVCVEESAAESRSARLALRRSALRRQVMRADVALRHTKDYTHSRALASFVKMQLSGQGVSGPVSVETVNHALTMRAMASVLTPKEKRKLRECGWSGGESCSMETTTGSVCAQDSCSKPPLPCGRYCLSHVTLEPEQRLYAACSAVFAGGERCKRPVIPLQDQTPLCEEHAWKRDNYDKMTRDWRPRNPLRNRVSPTTPGRANRRRRLSGKHHSQQVPESLSAPHAITSETSPHSNSSTYDSSEETTLEVHSENEFIATASNSNELEVEVGQVPPDDILDPAVLSQIPDEAFTEFFNQAEGGAPFAESSELAAALEAVLDERVLDERVLDERVLDTITDCVFSPRAQMIMNKIPVSPTVNIMEMSPVAPS